MSENQDLITPNMITELALQFSGLIDAAEQAGCDRYTIGTAIATAVCSNDNYDLSDAIAGNLLERQGYVYQYLSPAAHFPVEGTDDDQGWAQIGDNTPVLVVYDTDDDASNVVCDNWRDAARVVAESANEDVMDSTAAIMSDAVPPLQFDTTRNTWVVNLSW